MEITGRLIQLLPDVSGESARGPWTRGGFVIETDGDYPRKVAFTTFGEERSAMAKNIPMNSPVVVNFNPESREFNDRWYTDLRASRIQPFVPGQMPAQNAAAQGYNWSGAAAQQPQAAPAAAPMAPAAPAAAPAPQAAQQPAPGFASAPSMGDSEDDLPF